MYKYMIMNSVCYSMIGGGEIIIGELGGKGLSHNT